MKAFLSHSTKDKPLVEEVAVHLGRQFCLYDKFSFDSGEEFGSAIKRCLSESAVFVLFASRNSNSSTWVKFEIEEALEHKVRETIQKSLVYIIDDDFQLDEIPEWLRKGLIKRGTSPKVIA